MILLLGLVKVRHIFVFVSTTCKPIPLMIHFATMKCCLLKFQNGWNRVIEQIHVELPGESGLKTNFMEKGILNAHKSDQLQILFVLILILDGNWGGVDIDVYENIDMYVDLDLSIDLKTYFLEKWTLITAQSDCNSFPFTRSSEKLRASAFILCIKNFAQEDLLPWKCDDSKLLIPILFFSASAFFRIGWTFGYASFLWMVRNISQFFHVRVSQNWRKNCALNWIGTVCIMYGAQSSF